MTDDLRIRDFNDLPEYPRRRSRSLRAVLWLLALALLLWPRVAGAEPADTVGAIYAAAQNHGVSAGRLLSLASCETGGTFDADAKGDYRWREGRYVPTSRGPFQINDLPTGLDGHFRRQGYTDRTDPEQAADYVARVLDGEFVRDGVTLARWSCG